MLTQKKYDFIDNKNGEVIQIVKKPCSPFARETTNRVLKNELMHVFRKYGYLSDKKDYDIRIKTTSGNIAWININCIETIK